MPTQAKNIAMTKPVIMWAVKNEDGRLLPWTIRRYKDDSLYAIMKFHGITHGQAEEYGYRIVKVEVREVER